MHPGIAKFDSFRKCQTLSDFSVLTDLRVRPILQRKITFNYVDGFQNFENQDDSRHLLQLLDFAIARLDPTDFREK